MSKKIARGGGWVAAGKSVSVLGNFVAIMILAKALPPAEYGAYFVALSTVVIFAVSSTLGMDQLIVRLVSVATLGRGGGQSVRRLVRRCLVIVACGGLVCALVFVLVAPLVFDGLLGMPQLVPYTVLIAAWIGMASLQRQLSETFRGLMDYRSTVLFGGVRNSGIVSSVGMAAAFTVLWLAGCLTLFSALCVMTLTSSMVVLMGYITLRRRLSRLQSSPVSPGNRSQLRFGSAIAEGWPLWVAMLATTTNTLAGNWLASAFDTAAHVALFGVATRFMLILLAPMALIFAVLPPMVAQLFAARELERLERVLRSISGLIFLPVLAVVVILVFFGKTALAMIFGSYYQAAYPLVLILCSAQAVNVATGGWQIVLPMTGRKWEAMACGVVGLLTQMVLGSVLGAHYGVLGVAIGFGTSEVLTNLIGTALVHRSTGILTIASFNRDTYVYAVDLVAKVHRALSGRGTDPARPAS